MTVRAIRSLDEVHELIGTDLGPGPWQRIDQRRIDAFADATGDHQWIHVDPARAAHGPFGHTIAHGYLTLSLISGMTADIYSLELGSSRLNYGVDPVRFPAPVPVDSEVRLRCRFLSAEPRTSAVLLRIGLTVELRGHDRPACVAEKLSLVLLD